MVITLNLPPDIENQFLAEAQARGMSVDDFAQSILLAQIQSREGASPENKRPFGRKSLAQLFAESPLKGLDLDFSRSQDPDRPVEL